MCQLSTEGILYGCGHYIVTQRLRKRDCNNQHCVKSRLHPRSCPFCPQCKVFYGPDYEQKIVKQTKDYCSSCDYWYSGPASTTCNALPDNTDTA